MAEYCKLAITAQDGLLLADLPRWQQDSSGNEAYTLGDRHHGEQRRDRS
jgi:hypothetical protein